MSVTRRWRGTLHAVSSISHGGDSLGTVRYLRRERVLLPDGSVEDVPVLSGNMLRGVMRRLAADAWWEVVGRPRMSAAVAHAIWSGGSLAKSGAREIAFTDLTRAQQVCPVVGLFGSAAAGRILNGCLTVGKALPVCQETQHLLPPEGGWTGELSMWDLTQVEYYSRHPFAPPFSAASPAAVGLGESEEPGGLAGAGLMRFGVETFLPGSQFSWSVAATHPSDAELSLLRFLLDDACTHGVQVGGMGAAGLGWVRAHWDETGGDSEVTPGIWREMCAAFTAREVSDALAVLN